MSDYLIKNNERKVLHAGLVGLPNAGKSTLVNMLLGKKVSIVTNRAQTTRTAVWGTTRVDNTQICLMDAPGLFRPSGLLEKIIVKNAVNVVEEADVLLWIVDITVRDLESYGEIFRVIGSRDKPVICVLNKMDIVYDPVIISEFTEKLRDSVKFHSVLHVSALNGMGKEALLRQLLSMAVPGSWEAPIVIDDVFYACEITREYLFKELYYELPYSVTVLVEAWKDAGESLSIYQNIYIANERHKPILIGKKGSLLKKVGSLARAELSQYFKKKVSLFLHVSVRENWQNSTDANRLLHECKVY